MATIDIGKIKPVFKGTYDNSTAYVLDDIVYYNGSSYVAKTSTTGNLPTDTTKWNILASGSGGIWDSTLALGTAGKILQVNSGATALEFVDAPSGVIKKVHNFTYNSRVAPSNSANINAFTWSSSGFTPLDPVNNLMYVSGAVPMNSAGNNYSGYGLRFNHSGGTDYDFQGKGSVYGDLNSAQLGTQSYFFVIPANTLASGTYSIYHRHYTQDSQPDAYFPNSSDNSRIIQTEGHLTIFEYKN